MRMLRNVLIIVQECNFGTTGSVDESRLLPQGVVVSATLHVLWQGVLRFYLVKLFKRHKRTTYLLE